MKKKKRDNAAAELTIMLALEVLQVACQTRFGANAECESGEATIYISPQGVELTDKNGVIVAAGTETVTKAMMRKERKK
jgi:hypothetical protein